MSEENFDHVVRVHMTVRGRVQGVGFRAFTQAEASTRGLQGWVRNRPEGTVEVEAEGPQDILDTFLEAIKQGPRFSRVDQIIVDWKEPTRQTQGFAILH